MAQPDHPIRTRSNSLRRENMLKGLRKIALRTTLAAEMRSTIENEFSYSARWRTFLTGVHAGLQSFAAETLAAPAGVPA